MHLNRQLDSTCHLCSLLYSTIKILFPLASCGFCKNLYVVAIYPPFDSNKIKLQLNVFLCDEIESINEMVHRHCAEDCTAHQGLKSAIEQIKSGLTTNAREIDKRDRRIRHVFTLSNFQTVSDHLTET